MQSTLLDIKINKVGADAILPTYGSEDSAGADLYAYIPDEIQDYVDIQPHTTTKISVGIRTEIPKGYVGLIFPRSSVATKQDLAPANKVCVIDSDYRGEWFIPLHNHGNGTYRRVKNGDRIAQVIFLPIPKANFIETDTLSVTGRGEGGFGSTGR